MKKQGHSFRGSIMVAFAVFAISQFSNSQPVVGLDNWFNRETDSRTGRPFHYLWTDTAWSGYSKLGEIFKFKGARLTTIEKPVSRILETIDVYIIVDPDTTTESASPNYIMPDDARAIKKWVKKGGVIAVMANDAPNCEFTHLNSLTGHFGMVFNHVTLHPVKNDDFEKGACRDLPDHELFSGVDKIFLKEISDINISGKARAILAENRRILMAECQYGKGYVFAVGDPWLYNEYIDHARLPESFCNLAAAENLVAMLLRRVPRGGQ